MSNTSALLEEYQPEATLTIDEYEPYIRQERVDALKHLAGAVEGRGWANINSTFTGGGVAEMLRSVIPLARSLGIQARWSTIRGHDAFFQITKKFHNTLQGVDQPISLQELFETYLDNLAANAQNVQIESDLIIVHALERIVNLPDFSDTRLPYPEQGGAGARFPSPVFYLCPLLTTRLDSDFLWRHILYVSGVPHTP